MKERLQKLLAQANYGSRRAAETMIEQGRVRVNGKLAKLGDQADPATDVVEVDGKLLKLSGDSKIYIALNKPKNVVSTNIGHHGDERRTVRELIPMKGHLFTIGRLDADSEGLVVLTNDGELANRLSHPRYQHTKTYRVTVQGLPTADSVEKWQNGMFLSEEEGVTGAAFVSISKGAKDFSSLKVVMTEGKKRQIRRIAQMLGHPVKRLVRTHIGMLELGNLEPGEWRELDARDVKLLSTPAPELKHIRERKRKLGGYPPRARPDANSRPRRSTAESTREAERRPARSVRQPPSDRNERSGDAPKPARAPRRNPVRSATSVEATGNYERKPPRAPRHPAARDSATGDAAPNTERKPARPRRPAPRSAETGEGSTNTDRKPARPRRPAAPAARGGSDERSPVRKPRSNSNTPKPTRSPARPPRKRGDKPER